MAVLHRRGFFFTILLVICAVCSIHGQNTSPPSISVQPSPSEDEDSYIMDSRVPLELNCEATGTPPPTYKWLKYDLDGNKSVQLDPTDSRITITNGDLRVARDGEMTVVTKADEGLYQCIAKNAYGSALSTKITARIAFINKFSWTQPFTVTVKRGEKAVINCNPPESIPHLQKYLYWTSGRPGTPIVSTSRVQVDTNGNLVFANAQPEDQKDYRCNAPNYYVGETKQSPFVQLTVLAEEADRRKASFVYTPPSVQEVLRTKVLSLKCIAEGYPTPNITWSWENIEIPPNRIKMPENGLQGTELIIGSVTFNDAGSYTCSAFNGEGSPVRYTSTVTVRSAPYWINGPPENKIIAPKESVTITCQAGGIPPAVVSWLINGQSPDEIEDNPRRVIESGESNGLITVTKAEQADSAVFQCIAKNIFGEEITSVSLNVLAIPAEIQELPSLRHEVAEGDMVEMKCKPFGRPDPTVTWTFKGDIITSEGRHTIEDGGTNDGMLTIRDLVMEDKGVYNCNVTNDFGTQSASPELIVRMKTKVTAGPGQVNVIVQENAVLKCKIESDLELELTVIWSHNGVELNTEVDNDRYRQGGDNSLTVINAKRSDEGDYICNAITTFSSDMATGFLIVLSVPDPPINVKIVNPSGLLVDVQWTPGFDGNAVVSEYIIEYAVEYVDLGWNEMVKVGASTTDTTVDLKAYNTYRFRVKSRNHVGMSTPSEVSAGYTTPERKPSVNPGRVSGQGPQPNLMVVSWDRIHPVNYAGPNFKYVVKYRVKGETKWHEEEVGGETTELDVRSEVSFQEYDVQVISRNSVGNSTAPPVIVSGYSGESEPTAAPTDVKVEVEGPEKITVTWVSVPPESINGQIVGYRIYYSITIAAGSEKSVECQESPCVVATLKPFSSYSLEVAVYNGAGEGPRSPPSLFSTPQGAPGKVQNLKVSATSDRIRIDWDKPIHRNGILDGYWLDYSIMMGNMIENTTNVTINSPEVTMFIAENCRPNSEYRISVRAKTQAKEGEEEVEETKTRPEGEPTKLDTLDFVDIGLYSMNASFALPSDGPVANYVAVKYYKKGEEESEAITTEKIDVLGDEQVIYIKDLEPNTMYVFSLIAINDIADVEGPWKEEMTALLPGQQKSRGFKVESWFVALVVIIIVLLLILLIICVLKSQKGGKYNVSDKEQQLKGDIESTPLKDEGGFEEFQPRDGNMDEGAPLTSGSHPSLNESDPGSSESDSLKEYADGDTGKFNEEGSFIGQYGDRKTRPPDDNQEGPAAYSTFV